MPKNRMIYFVLLSDCCIFANSMNIPEDFELYTRRLIGDDEYKSLADALATESPVSIRLNPAKWTGELSAQAVPWSEKYGRYLETRPPFTFDPLLHSGAYYVQEASSMFLTQVVEQYVDKPVVALDLCASPGGKSTLLRAALPEGSLLVSNEPIRPRAQVLSENITKWGHPLSIVTNNYPADFLKFVHLFDLIVADVPCSGEGMFRKDEVAVSDWSTAKVAECESLQRSIINDIWRCLKPGGLLVYSTCTYNALEDEGNVEWIVKNLGAEFLKVETKPEWNIKGNTVGTPYDVYHFMPHITKGEGFFLCLMRKPLDAEDDIPEEKPAKKKKGKDAKPKSEPAFPKELKQYVSGDFEFVWRGEQPVAFPTAYIEVYDSLSKELSVMHAGIELAMLKGRDWQPDVALALSTALYRDTFPTVELDYMSAIAYLRKEAVAMPDGTPRGYVLVTYKNHPLGFVKNIGNRANNLYPQEWRIRSGFIPKEIEEKGYFSFM